MSNIDKLTSTSNYSAVGQEQLFTELTLEEGAAIKGGLTYELSNNSGIPINFNINGKSDVLNPGDVKPYSYFTAPTVGYDSQIGPGYVPVYQKLVSDPGQNVFDVANGGSTFILTQSSPPGGISRDPGSNIVSPGTVPVPVL
ncbi:hypothetical protein [Nostoc sp.]|uniref:hypothetical protein n=1 Tax=Nostoc sp. TaxID=1180 RepID=UPI002FFBDA75